MKIHITTCSAYRFEHISFEFHAYLGLTFLRLKDLEPKPKQLRPARDYAAIARWMKLTRCEQEKHRIN